jgi:hypothetical protein
MKTAALITVLTLGAIVVLVALFGFSMYIECTPDCHGWNDSRYIGR